MRRRRVERALGAVLILLAAAPARAEWSVAAFLGGAHTRSGSLQIDQVRRETRVTLEPIDYETRALASPVYYGYRVSYFFSRAGVWGIESELIHLKVFAHTGRQASASGTIDGGEISEPVAVDSIVQRFAMSHGLNLALVNLVVRTPPVAASGDVRRVLLAVRVGAGPTAPHVEAQIAGESRDDYQLGSLGMQVAAGGEVRISKRLSGLIEYKLTHVNEHADLADGRARARVLTHHGVAGIAVRF